MDIQAAIRFVSSHGDPTEQARLQFLMVKQPASQQAVEALLNDQRGDGGWCPPWAASYSSLDATCFRLSQAWQLGIGMQEPAIARAIEFLEERQSSKGSWEEDAAVAAVAPAWAAPGDLAAQLYLTANCGYWIALMKPKPVAATLASSFLFLHLQPLGRMPTFLHAHWLSAGLWLLLDQAGPSKMVLSYLLSRLSELGTSNLAWMLTTLCDAGLPSRHELVRQSVDLLIAQQQPDGRWESEDGSARDVHATLEALLAIQMAGRFPSGL